MILGVVFALVTTLAYNGSFVLQKHALGSLPPLNPRRPMRAVWVLATSPRWLAGFTLMLSGLATQLGALSRIPLTVAQPVFSSGIAFLLLLTVVVLRERLTGRESIGLAAIVAGVVCVVASLSSRTDTAGKGGHALTVLAVAIPSIVLGLTIFIAAGRATGTDLLYGLAAGLVYGVVGLIMKGLSASIDYHGGPIRLVTSVLVSPYLYLAAPVMVTGMLVFQISLQRCRASIVAPVSSVVSTLYTVTAGTVVFGEHLPGDPFRLGLRLVGFLLICAALFWLPRVQAEDPVTRPDDPSHSPQMTHTIE